MATLANQTISSTYDGLIKTSTDQPVPISGVQLLEDGVGNSLALSVGRANQGVTVTGTLTATSITGVLADGVTATTQTLGDNSTKVATTAYVDAAVTAEDLDFAGDSGTGAVDLDSQTFTIAGTANEIETSASGQTITIGLPNNVNISGNLAVDTNTLYVDATNNRVGIGTSSPAAVLEVNNDTAGETVAIFEGTYNPSSDVTLASFQRIGGAVAAAVTYKDANIGIEFGTTTAHSLILTTGDTERMRIDSSGNVGIGTTSPATTLDVNGEIRFSVANPIESVTNALRSTDDSGFSLRAAVSSDANPTYSLKGDLDTGLFFPAANTLAVTTGGSERMRITSAGNVGIGNVGSNAKLEVSASSGEIFRADASGGAYRIVANQSGVNLNGNVGIGTAPNYTLHIDSNTTTTRLQITNSTTGQGGGVGMQILQIGNDSTITNRSNGHLSFETNGTERMRIDSAGNVGIGTSSPSVPLDIQSNSNASAIRIRGRSADDIAEVDFYNYANNTLIARLQADTDYLLFDIGGSERMRVKSNGDIKIQQGSLLGFSDFSSGSTGVGLVGSGENLLFYTSGAEKMRILSSGGITFNGDTAAANALDDYEEGTWTPNVTFGGASVGITYTGTGGTYTKIGRQVTVTGIVILTSKGSSTGVFEIIGLPYTIGSGNSFYASGSIGYFTSITFADQISFWGEQNTTTLKFRETTSAGVQTNITDADLSNNSSIMITLTYFTA